ncbi:MAG: hypothetical protein ACRD21_09305 [Vicinamibacteria bacterium]
MKKTIHRIGVIALAALLGSFAASLHGQSSAQMSEAEMTEALDRLGELLGLPPVSPEELKRRVADLGGLGFEKDVPVDFMSRDQLSHYIRELFDEEYPMDYAEQEERMLRGFGFLTEDQDLRTLREKVLHENVAGFYDERPGVKKLFAISSGRNLNVMNQLVLAHELRHALQDQHVVIRDQLEVKSDYDDRRLSALCLLEGDASILMQHYMTSGVTSNRPEAANLFKVFSQSLSGEEIAAMFAGPALQEAPAVVQEQLIAPYFEGQKLATAVHEKGGFALLNEKLRTPPRSMEQVLHPEKYLGTVDEPVQVALPEVGTATPVFEGVLGELLIRVLLRGGPAAATAEAASAGWGGDLYAVLQSGSGAYRLLWRSAWDSENDAREFRDALTAYVGQRFPGENNHVTLEGKEVFFERRDFR